MADLTISKKKDWAKLLYTKENLTQEEIAERVGVTRVTVNKWINKEKWELLKVSISMTKEEQLRHLYDQFADLNKTILSRPAGERNPMPAEAENQLKLTKSIKNIENEFGIAEITSVTGDFRNWIRANAYEQLKPVTKLLDAYVESKIV